MIEIMLERHPLVQTILRLARERKVITAADVLRGTRTQVSRQYVTRVLRMLTRAGRLVRAGTTRGARYALPRHVHLLHPVVRRRLRNMGLSEGQVFDDLRLAAPFIDRLPRNVRDVVSYGFHEMLNNAIEHSESDHIEVAVGRTAQEAYFTVNDFGVGVFHNVMRKRHLTSALDAIQDLLKGKTTTAPNAHSGEGIFFTSRVADVFLLESDRHRLTVDNTIPDHFIGTLDRRKRGTRVTFRIALASARTLQEVFRRYTVDEADPAFDRSEVRIKLYTLGTNFVSRSHARRLLVGLEKFRSVILDFQDVQTIGQGFADEIFRVFRLRHPETDVVPVNMVEAVQFMVRRAREGA